MEMYRAISRQSMNEGVCIGCLRNYIQRIRYNCAGNPGTNYQRTTNSSSVNDYTRNVICVAQPFGRKYVILLFLSALYKANNEARKLHLTRAAVFPH